MNKKQKKTRKDHSNRTYTEKGIWRIVRALVTEAQCKRDELDVFWGFIDKHPWTMKLLSHFAEAHNFEALAKHPEAKICFATIEPRMVAWRAEKGYPRQVKLVIGFGRPHLRDEPRPQYLTFEEVGLGRFRSIYG